MDAAGIPAPILDLVGREVHRLRFNDGLKQTIETLPTPFERDLLNPTQTFKQILNRHTNYVFVDKEVPNVFTAVLELTTETFLVFTVYRNGFFNEYMLMEIGFKKDMEAELLQFYRNAPENTAALPFEAFREAYYDTVRWDSLNYLEYLCQIDADTMNRMAVKLEKPWNDPAAMVAWFMEHEDDFGALTADPTIGRTMPI